MRGLAWRIGKYRFLAVYRSRANFTGDAESVDLAARWGVPLSMAATHIMAHLLFAASMPPAGGLSSNYNLHRGSNSTQSLRKMIRLPATCAVLPLMRTTLAPSSDGTAALWASSSFVRAPILSSPLS